MKHKLSYPEIGDGVFLVPLEDIHFNRYQGRATVDKTHVSSLAKSILEKGLMQPAEARWVNDRLELIFGENRVRAHRLLSKKHPEFKHIKIKIVEASDEDAFERSISENIDRANLTTSDKIKIIEHGKTLNYTSEKLGNILKMTDAAVRSLWRLRNLPPEILVLLDHGKLSQVQARRILSACQLADPRSITEKILNLPELTEANIHDEILKAFREAGGVHPLQLSDGTTDKMPATWEPGVFSIPDWRQVSSAFPFRNLDKGTYSQLASEEKEPSTQIEEVVYSMLTHMRAPGPCNTCPFSATIHKQHYCAIAACARMKQDRYAGERLSQLSGETGIAIYKDGDGLFREAEAPFYDGAKSVKSALQRKSKSLRLLPVANLTHTHYYTNSHWAQLVWVGAKANEQELPSPTSKQETQKVESHKTEITLLEDYLTEILLNWLKQRSELVAFATILLNLEDESHRERAIVGEFISTILVRSSDTQIPEQIQQLSGQFDIPLPQGWKKKIESITKGK